MVVNIVCVEVRQDIGNIFKKGPHLGCRHIQMVLYFLLMTYSYCMRSVLSVAIVAMNDNSTTTNEDIPVYHWKDRSIVLSAFFWGYLIFQIPATSLANKFGIKRILVCSTTLDSIACILVPTMADLLGSKGVMICRFLQGVGQGFNLPLLNTLLGQWAPPSERSRIGTFAYAGSVFGNIVCLIVTGFICSSSLGWPFSFYLWGCFGIGWVIIWSFFGFDKPSSHKNITTDELNYIETSLGQCTRKNHKTPWRDILKSGPAWAVLFANMGVNWGSAILSTLVPTFLSKVLQFDIKKNALLSAAPYLAMWLSSFIFSIICDIIINKSWVKRGTARKIFNSIGSFCPALGLIAIGFFNRDKAELCVTMLILIGGTTAAGYCGFQVNHLDLSPNHSGILIGLSNGLTSIFSVISPHTVHYIVTDLSNPQQWRIVFVTAAAIYIVTNIFYVIFASGEVQPWNQKFDEADADSSNSSHNGTKRTSVIINSAQIANVIRENERNNNSAENLNGEGNLNANNNVTQRNIPVNLKNEFRYGKGIDNFGFKNNAITEKSQNVDNDVRETRQNNASKVKIKLDNS